MLETGAWGSQYNKDLINTGWTCAYTVQSILIQLQNFIALARTEESFAYIDLFVKMDQQSFKCKCPECGSTVANPKPPLDPNVIKSYKGEGEEWLKKCAAKCEKAIPFVVALYYPQLVGKESGLKVSDLNPCLFQSYFRGRRYVEEEVARKKLQKATIKKHKVIVKQLKNPEFYRKRQPLFHNLVKYENLTGEERKYQASIGRYTLVVPVLKPVVNSIKHDFATLTEDSVFEFKIKNSQPKTSSISNSSNNSRSRRIENDWKIVRSFRPHSLRPIKLIRTTDGIAISIETNEQGQNHRTKLQLWEDIYPMKQKESEKLESKLVLPKLKDEITVTITNVPFININQKGFASRNNNNNRLTGHVSMTMKYDMSSYFVKGTEWQMVCPDENRKGNFICVNLATNLHNLTYIESMYYHIKMSDEQLIQLVPAFGTKEIIIAERRLYGTQNKEEKGEKKEKKNEKTIEKPVAAGRGTARTRGNVRVIIRRSNNNNNTSNTNAASQQNTTTGAEAKGKVTTGKAATAKDSEVYKKGAYNPVKENKKTAKSKVNQKVDEQSSTAVMEPEKDPELEDESKQSITLVPRGPLRIMDLPPEMKAYILSFLDMNSLLAIAEVSEEFEYFALNSPVFLSKEVYCFHTKDDFEDPDTILGVPFSITTYPGSNKIESATPILDILSYSSYSKHGVRKAVSKEPFQLWFPIYINPRHAQRSMPIAIQILIKMYGGESKSEFDPLWAVELLTKFMNAMVVQLMNKSVWVSERAVEGYMMFHHMLLGFLEEYPEIQEWAERKLSEFIEEEQCRIKKNTGDLGQFITLLGISEKYKWEDLKRPLLDELFDRNVKWLGPHLADLKWDDPKIHGDMVSRMRIIETFQHTTTSQRLVMFHVAFLKIFVERYESKRDIKGMYDRSYGRPSEDMRKKIQVATKEIQAAGNWIEFFRKVDIDLPTPKEMTRWLRQSVWNSRRKRYHTRTYRPNPSTQQQNNYARPFNRGRRGKRKTKTKSIHGSEDEDDDDDYTNSSDELEAY